jgi:site-specific DNA recombinase
VIQVASTRSLARTPRLTAGDALAKTVRVAIYTRVSTDERLDQEFNSLDAQRQAALSFIESQRSEGWTAVEEPYDDAGYTGANTDRPAFKRLVSDIEAGRVDAVAVYKLDRLSRSIADFVRLMAFFGEHGVVFVSVTQQFSTSTAVGRMTLNLLATFAEFERETIAERTRDKMLATRRKGMWTGGRPPLGYDLVSSKLIVNAKEAASVVAMFALFLETGSIIETVTELNRRGWTTKSWTTKDGTVVRGRPFDKTTLRTIVASPLYVGRVRAGKDVVPGIQPPIVAEATWDAVQKQLIKRPGVVTRQRPWASALQGLVRCARCGRLMGHTYTSRGSRRYPYLVCESVQKRGAAACPGSRVALGKLEQALVQRIRGLGADPMVVAATIASAKEGLASRGDEIEAGLRGLQEDKRRIEGERTHLLDAIAHGGSGDKSIRERLGEVETDLAGLAPRGEELRREREGLEGQDLDEGDLRSALQAFDPIWEELFPAERARLLRTLIESVSFDGRVGEVEVRFSAEGAKLLARELAGKDGRNGAGEAAR